MPSLSSASQIQPNIPSLHLSPRKGEEYSFHESLMYLLRKNKNQGEKYMCIYREWLLACVFAPLDLHTLVGG